MATRTHRDLFKGTAPYYARYRRGYPAALFDHLRERFELDGTGRLLDLGCGTGQLALPLAASFAQVIGMDPEPEMLAEAAYQAAQRRIANVVWVEGGSDDLGPHLGTFRLVTIGSALHWMDRGAALDALYPLIDPDGGIAIVDADPCRSRTNNWQKAIGLVIRRWLGKVRRAGSSTYTYPEGRHEQFVARSRFTGMEIYRLRYRYEWNIDSIVGNLYSTSYASQAVLGELREPFERDLRATLRRLEPSGMFDEDICLTAILAWKR